MAYSLLRAGTSFLPASRRWVSPSPLPTAELHGYCWTNNRRRRHSVVLAQGQVERLCETIKEIQEPISSFAVPATCASVLKAKLRIVDSLENLGIDCHFKNKKDMILDEVYRFWLQNDQEMHLDTATLAMAFRLLRLHKYDVSSGVFGNLDEDHFSHHSADNTLHYISTLLELHKASQIRVSQDEKVLKKLSSLSRSLLEECINSCTVRSEVGEDIIQEVKFALKFPFYADLEGLKYKRNIEKYRVTDILTGNYSSIFGRIDSKDVLDLAVQEFSSYQQMCQDEFKHIDRWAKDCKLDQLEIRRQEMMYCFLTAVGTLYSPQMSEARMCWAKFNTLAYAMDDLLFDLAGSVEEQSNFLELLNRWDPNYEEYCCSNRVKILFSALYTTINDYGGRASALHGFNVTSHLIEIWRDFVQSMIKEAEWRDTKVLPAVDNYIANGSVSVATGVITLSTMYFVGAKLSLHIISCPEFHEMIKLLGSCGRLLNDILGFEREKNQGKAINAIYLMMAHGQGMVSEEDAEREAREMIDRDMTELLRLVLQTDGSMIPRECKDLLWRMSRIIHITYGKTDDFRSGTEVLKAMYAVVHEPLRMPHLAPDNSDSEGEIEGF